METSKTPKTPKTSYKGFTPIEQLGTIAHHLESVYPYPLSASIYYQGDYYNESLVGVSYSKDEKLLTVTFDINEYAGESSALYTYIDEQQGITSIVDTQDHTFSLLFDEDTLDKIYTNHSLKCFASNQGKSDSGISLNIISNKDGLALGILSSKQMKFLSNLTFKEQFTQSSKAGQDLLMLLKFNLLGKIVQVKTPDMVTTVLPTENYVVHPNENTDNRAFDLEMYLHTIHIDDVKGRLIKVSYQNFEKNNVDVLVYKLKLSPRLTLLISPI